MVLKIKNSIFKRNGIIESLDATMIITYFNLRLRKYGSFLLSTDMWPAGQNSLHLGSKIGGIKLGRPRLRARQDILDFLTWDLKSCQLIFTLKK